MKVAVGSKNPAKIEAVKQAFEKVFPDIKWEVVGVEVSSEVSDQPMSDEESITGATNRALKARKALEADFGVGAEGGIHKTNETWFDSGWIVIVDSKGKKGISSSLRMQVPEKMMKRIHAGVELGVVDDEIFGTTMSKHDMGHYGLMTKGHIVRAGAYEHAVIAALAPFLHEELFSSPT
jgi:inosine/xanthosine triphosphatase